MPFRDESVAGFGPDDLDTLTTAFNAAWQQLPTAGVKLDGEDRVRLLKKRLAQSILAAATPGRLNVENLTSIGIQAVLDCVAQSLVNGPAINRTTITAKKPPTESSEHA